VTFPPHHIKHNMRNCRRRNAITAYSNSNEAVALRTLSHFLQTALYQPRSRGSTMTPLAQDSQHSQHFLSSSGSNGMDSLVTTGSNAADTRSRELTALATANTDTSTSTTLTNQSRGSIDARSHFAPAA
jgi:hypothetical protein